MKQMTTTAMREANGGASKYVYCPVCGYRKTNSLWVRMTQKDANIKKSLTQVHYYTGNLIRYGANNKTQAVHK